MWRPNHGFDENFNAGNNDPDVGAVVQEHLSVAIDQTPRGSLAYNELERREEWLTPRVDRMEYGEKSNWWDGPLDQGSSVSTS